MRITQDILLRLARENVQKRVEKDHGILGAYLIGSVLTPEPLLGGTTDIDLVFVTIDRPKIAREIVRLSNEVHLDISYHARDEYEPPRELRGNPWLGHELYDPMVLHESGHFFDFTQASLRSGFDDPEGLLQRVRTLASHGREIWLDLQSVDGKLHQKHMMKYLKAVYHAANAVAEWSGPPLSERRLLLDFPTRAEAIERPAWTGLLIDLLGGTRVDGHTLSGWLGDFAATFQAAVETGGGDPRIHPARLNYYLKACEELAGGDRPVTALWPLLHTWTMAAVALPTKQVTAWTAAAIELGLIDAFDQRLQELDSLLDGIEEIADGFAATHGLEPVE